MIIRQYERRNSKRPPVISTKLRACSLCSGIGGMDYSFRQAGFEIALQCEIDPFCLEILAKNFGAPIHTDLTTMPCIPPDIHVILGTFPCQNASRRNRAGTRTGVEGLETGKIGELWRLLELPSGPKVPYILMESVPGLLEEGDADQPLILPILKQLQRLGYSWAYREVSTLHLTGLPQDRKRLLILASLNADACDILLAPLSVCSQYCTCVECRRGEEARMYVCDLGERTNPPCAERTPTITASNGGRLCLVDTKRNTLNRLTVSDHEKLFGFPDQWSEPLTCTAQKNVNGKRLRALGNSIPPHLCDFVAREILNLSHRSKYVPNPNHADKAVKLNAQGSMPPAAYGVPKTGGGYAMYTPSHLIKRAKSWRPESQPFRRLEELLPLDVGRPALTSALARRYLIGLGNHRLELVPKLRRAFMEGAGLNALEVCNTRPKAVDIVWADFGRRWVPPVWPVFLLRENEEMIERVVGGRNEVWVHCLPEARPAWVPKDSIVTLKEGMAEYGMQRGRSRKKSVNVFAVDCNSRFKEAIEMAMEEHAFALQHDVEVTKFRIKETEIKACSIRVYRKRRRVR